MKTSINLIKKIFLIIFSLSCSYNQRYYKMEESSTGILINGEKNRTENSCWTRCLYGCCNCCYTPPEANMHHIRFASQEKKKEKKDYSEIPVYEEQMESSGKEDKVFGKYPIVMSPFRESKNISSPYLVKPLEDDDSPIQRGIGVLPKEKDICGKIFGEKTTLLETPSRGEENIFSSPYNVESFGTYMFNKFRKLFLEATDTKINLQFNSNLEYEKLWPKSNQNTPLLSYVSSEIFIKKRKNNTIEYNRNIHEYESRGFRPANISECLCMLYLLINSGSYDHPGSKYFKTGITLETKNNTERITSDVWISVFQDNKNKTFNINVFPIASSSSESEGFLKNSNETYYIYAKSISEKKKLKKEVNLFWLCKPMCPVFCCNGACYHADYPCGIVCYDQATCSSNGSPNCICYNLTESCGPCSPFTCCFTTNNAFCYLCGLTPICCGCGLYQYNPFTPYDCLRSCMCDCCVKNNVICCAS